MIQEDVEPRGKWEAVVYMECDRVCMMDVLNKLSSEASWNHQRALDVGQGSPQEIQPKEGGD